MPAFSRSAAASVLCGLFAAVLFASCYSTPSRDRGSLGDAMDAARDDSQDRSVPSKPRFPYDDPYDDPYDKPFVPVWPSPPVSKPNPPVAKPKQPQVPPSEVEPEEPAEPASIDPVDAETAFGIRYGVSPFVSGDADRIDDVSMLFGFAAGDTELFALLSAKLLEPASGSDLYLSTADNLTMFSIGGEFRRLPFPDRVFLSPWLGFGAEAFIMGWEFRNPLVAGSDTITSDMLGGFLLYPSLGAYLIRNSHASVSVFVLPAVSFFREVTAEGFNNDVFLPMLSCEAGVEILLR